MLNLLLDWLKLMLASKSPATLYNYSYALKRLNAELLADGYELDLLKLRPLHIRKAYSRLGSSIGHNTLASVDRALRAVFNKVERYGKEDFDLPDTWRSPMHAVERVSARRVHKLALSEAQATSILRRPRRRGFAASRNHCLVAFLLMTGCRVSEALAMQRADVDLDRRLADLRVTKGSRPRYVHLPSELVRLLSRYLRQWEKGPLLFPSRTNKPLSRRYVYRAVHRAALAAGLDVRIGPHALRRTFVTLLHNRGAPLGFIQEAVGHSNVKTTMGYLELTADAKAKLTEQFANFRGA